MADLLNRFRAWRNARYWRRLQLAHLLNLLHQDNRWMAHDKTAAALTDRYLAALSNGWERVYFEDVSNLRDRLGLNPHAQRAAADDALLHCRQHGRVHDTGCRECKRFLDARIAYGETFMRAREASAAMSQNGRCKFASGVARCVSWCGDPICSGTVNATKEG